MRKTMILAAATVAGLFGLATFAQATPARPGVPTCLIANGGSGGHFTKTLTCVELVVDGAGDTGSGRYAAPAGGDRHTLLVTVDYQRLGHWLPMAWASARGTGDLAASTRAVRAPWGAATRACVTVDLARELCTR
jgi:hypothetical protein